MIHLTENVVLLIALGLPISCCALLLLISSFLMGFLSYSPIFVCRTHSFPVFVTLRTHKESEKAKGKVVHVRALKTYKGVEVRLHLFLTSTLDRGEWLQTFPDILSAQSALLSVECHDKWVSEPVWMF
jgi:hypothetical protein